MGVVQRQLPLPLSKAAAIAFQSLRVRLGRSLLTLLTIGMAIAFLAFIWITRASEPGLAAATPGAAVPPQNVPRTVWLLALSLLVCLVGITNAMLMSVMERFREIGTMKCLGALDSFILKLFFLESVFLGAAGSLAGALLGTLLASAQLHARFGAMAGRVSWGMLAGSAAGSAAVGVVITAAAALYPARRAARMDPIAAMRVEV